MEITLNIKMEVQLFKRERESELYDDLKIKNLQFFFLPN